MADVITEAAVARRTSVLTENAATLTTGVMADDSSFALRTVLPPARRWILRMTAADALAAQTIGRFDVGQAINTLRETAPPKGGACLSARLGPDEWLLIDEAAGNDATTDVGDGGDFMPEMTTKEPWSLVDISHRHAAMELRGTRARDVLNTGCALNLSEKAFPAGSATRTLFAKADIILMRRLDGGARPYYRLECGRSFGRYLRDHLQNSAVLIGAA